MSTEHFDTTKYYPSYVNPNPQLTPGQFRQIQNSWKLVKDGEFDDFKQQELISDSLGFWGLEFYDTLFELDPALKPLFKNKFNQSRMLTQMVDAALGLLPGTIDPVLGEEKTEIDPQLIPILVDLASKHVSYNVKAGHYETVGLALVSTLQKTLGSNFDVETKAAWVELWSLICTVMIPEHIKKAQELGVDV
ncbi:globin domain-containing protein [Calothrix sp. NIES-2098]|uniref:globin domain-containing protein n=1 Tax=Calothrix sp. NIES-2098 TaxID=1954171 RepID=UPI000B5E2D82|nr:Globin-like protein [Calothrix sp. NIES-2098]